MSVTILVCGCGRRIKAPGAVAGRVGRCPGCGSPLKIPDAPVIDHARPTVPREPSGGGYSLDPRHDPADSDSRSSRKSKGVSEIAPALVPPRIGPSLTASLSRTPMADGFLPALKQPEGWWLPCTLFPLRGAECLGIIALLSPILWAFTVLVPEYCLSIYADADSMGAGLMGYLVVLISGLPAIILSPLIVCYMLQYLGRVLVSSAMGETVPPRTPDRNFDGFFNGLTPWFIWLILGLGVGLLPMALATGATDQPLLAFGLILLGTPYILTALMMSFLHDNPMAPAPWGVVGTLLRHGVSLLPNLLGCAIILATGMGTFAIALALREKYFGIYLLAALVCWGLALWIAIVTMRILGVYYFHHKDSLRWHHHQPRWGVAWRL
jgi:hypothetical protein